MKSRPFEVWIRGGLTKYGALVPHGGSYSTKIGSYASFDAARKAIELHILADEPHSLTWRYTIYNDGGPESGWPHGALYARIVKGYAQ